MTSSITNWIAHAGFFPGRKPAWRPDHDMPDMTNKIVILTGFNTGIGFESCKHLLKAGAKVYGLSRTPEKGEKAVQELSNLGYKGQTIYVQCDLADLASVRKAASQILEQEKQIHVLINNAGVMILSAHEAAKTKTAQGHEIQAGTNVLGHNFLTELLKPALIEAASHSEKGSVRIVFVSSSAHFLLPTRHMIKNWDMSNAAAAKYKPDALYGRSKLGNVHQMQAFADELESKGVIVAAVHPGNIRSELQRYASTLERFVIGTFLWPVYYGCISQLYAATAKDDSIHRSYYVPWARKMPLYSMGTDKAKIAKTMQWCQENSKGF